jgi:hypothetical protein
LRFNRGVQLQRVPISITVTVVVGLTFSEPKRIGKSKRVKLAIALRLPKLIAEPIGERVGKSIALAVSICVSVAQPLH